MRLVRDTRPAVCAAICCCLALASATVTRRRSALVMTPALRRAWLTVTCSASSPTDDAGDLLERARLEVLQEDRAHDLAHRRLRHAHAGVARLGVRALRRVVEAGVQEADERLVDRRDEAVGVALARHELRRVRLAAAGERHEVDGERAVPVLVLLRQMHAGKEARADGERLIVARAGALLDGEEAQVALERHVHGLIDGDVLGGE